MIKVLIADDEPVFIKYLKVVIDWEAYGFQICAECHNGEEALRQAILKKPDLALVDIEMPVMNGIQLSCKLKEILPDTSIIVITGCTDFENAQKAIKIGVMDFIVKPFDKEELLMTLLKVKKLCKKMREEQLDKEILQEYFFNQLINNEWSVSDEEALEQFSSIGITSPSQSFMVASIEIDDMYLKWKDASEIILWKYAVSNVLSEIIEIEGKNIVFNGSQGRIISLLCFDNEAAKSSFNIKNYQKLCDLIKKYFSFTVTVGIGNYADCYKNIHNSFIESIYALQSKTILGSGRMIEYFKLESRSGKINFYSNEINKKLSMSLQMSNIDGVMNNLDEIHTFIEKEQLSLDITNIIIFGLISLCLSYVNESGISIESVFGKSFSPYQALKNSNSIDSVFDYITELYKKALTHANTIEEASHSESIFREAKEYIDANYAESNLGVQKVSKNVYVSSRYLSRIFKQKTGMTVGDYITGIRMQKAKELLVSGGIKLSAVAEMVGYCDEGYFCKCFKKHYGVTPGAVQSTKTERIGQQ